MSQRLAAQDRSALIKLASGLSPGSPERIAILAGLTKQLPSKVLAMFEPFLKIQDKYIKSQVTQRATWLLGKAREAYPKPTSSKYGWGDTFKERVMIDAWIEKYGEDNFQKYGESMRSFSSPFESLFGIWGGIRIESSPLKKAVLQFGWEGIHKKSVFQTALNKQIEETIYINRIKLTAAINKSLGNLPISSVDLIHASLQEQGVEGAFKITLEDGTTGSFTTESIRAGGWNIQQLHLRYLIKISDTLKSLSSQIKEDAGFDPEIIKVLKVLVPYKKLIKETENHQLSHEARRAVEKLKGQSRNFGPLIRAKLMHRYVDGYWAVRRYKYIMTDLGLKALDMV